MQNTSSFTQKVVMLTRYQKHTLMLLSAVALVFGLCGLVILDDKFGNQKIEDAGHCQAQRVTLTEIASGTDVTRNVDQAVVACASKTFWVYDKRPCPNANDSRCQRPELLKNLRNTRVGSPFKCEKVVWTDYTGYLKGSYLRTCSPSDE